MNRTHSDESRSNQRYKLDRKLTIAITFFAVAGLLLMLFSNLATSTMSSLRAYTTLQGNWTREREDAAFNVYQYIEDGHEEYLQEFHKSIGWIRNVSQARELMEKEGGSHQRVRSMMEQAGTHPEDISGMIRTYVWLNDFSYFVEVVNLWEKSDSLAYQLDTLAHRVVKQRSNGGTLSDSLKRSLKNRVDKLDQKLTEAQIGINEMLGQGVRLLETITFWSTTGAGVLLFIIGFLFTYRFRRSIRKWRRSLQRSEKRYRSLFDNNPNAVFSLDREGQFITGNQALEDLTGYTNRELREMTYMPLVHPDYKEKVQNHFAEALDGSPQSYESIGLHRDGTEYEVHVTNLPIVVDGEIEGVYGIAQDITERKKANRKLQDSLEEKKTLLAEIHHRVKNNLAIISGLLELQADEMEENKLKNDLLNTRSRIHSMAMVHEKLYKSNSLSKIEMPTYARDLAQYIRQTMEAETEINLEYDFDDVNLDITQAIPCGLLLNEVVVNAFKYAFDGRERGTIGIELKQQGKEVHLRIHDDGIGLPEEIDIGGSTSLGLTLIKTLTEQLNGRMEIDRSHGTEFEISFAVKDQGFLQTA